MKLLTLLLALITCSLSAEPVLQICHNEYALCAASSTEKTGGKVSVDGVLFDQGVSVCPVLSGNSIADMNLTGGTCDAPEGQVWSTFSAATEFPQLPDWKVKPAVHRTFTTTAKPGGGMSNMWSYPCIVRKEPVNGVKLADCYGPLNESPWTSGVVPVGSEVITDAPKGVPNPVGGNLPVNE